jgi:hypothetical protein
MFYTIIIMLCWTKALQLRDAAIDGLGGDKHSGEVSGRLDESIWETSAS